MIKVKEAIVVEGRYDKNTLSQIVDAPIFQTNGFGIRNDPELMTLLRNVAKKRGLIVFTDSDGAGFVIRNFLKGAIPAQYLKHAYIPDIPGKERRKSVSGKEGLLGVEGMTKDVILSCLQRAGATFDDEEVSAGSEITKQVFMELGLSGGADSRQKRIALLKRLDFPAHMSSNALQQAVNALFTAEEFKEIVLQLEK